MSAEPTDEKKPEPRPCSVPVKPGNGNAAYAAGCEDEWAERMKRRYGGEW